MRKLVLWADDFGVNAARTAGIIAWYNTLSRTFKPEIDAGSVQLHANLLVNGEETARAAAFAREHQWELGLHINVTEGTDKSLQRWLSTGKKGDGSNNGSLKTNCSSSSSSDGVLFSGKLPVLVELSQYKKGAENVALFRSLVECIRRQVEHFKELCGYFPRYIDGHHHVHALPLVMEAVEHVARDLNLCFVYRSTEDPTVEHLSFVAATRLTSSLPDLSEDNTEVGPGISPSSTSSAASSSSTDASPLVVSVAQSVDGAVFAGRGDVFGMPFCRRVSALGRKNHRPHGATAAAAWSSEQTTTSRLVARNSVLIGMDTTGKDLEHKKISQKLASCFNRCKIEDAQISSKGVVADDDVSKSSRSGKQYLPFVGTVEVEIMTHVGYAATPPPQARYIDGTRSNDDADSRFWYDAFSCSEERNHELLYYCSDDFRDMVKELAGARSVQ